MNKMSCRYSVIRYIPDPIKNEARNIGIIVQCKEADYINCKFLKNVHAKLSTTATQADIRIIKAYIDEFDKTFNPFAKFPSTRLLSTEEIDVFNKDYLSNLADQGFGKIQFTEPQGSLIDDPEKELEYLYSTYVGEEKSLQDQLIKRTRLKTEIKREFKKRNILALSKKETKGFEVDVKIPGGRSKVEYMIDFALENGKLYLLETVDMRKKDEKIWTLETFEAAVKFDDIKHSENGNKIEPYSIVALPDHDKKNDYLKILKAYSTVFRYDEENEREKFLYEMKKLIQPKSYLF